MTYRKPPEMSPEDKGAVIRDLRSSKRQMEITKRMFHAEIRDALTHGFTTRELGAALDVDAATVSRWSRNAA